MSDHHSDSGESALTELSTTSSEIDIFERLQDDLDSVVIADLDIDESIKRAKTIVNKLANDPANSYTPPKTSISQDLARVLRAMLDCDVELAGRQYAVKTILLCAKRAEGHSGAERRKELIANLRAVGVTWLTHFLFIFKAGSRSHSSQFDAISDIATPTIDETVALHMPLEPLGPRNLDREQVLERDGHACLITGIKDVSHPSLSGDRTLHISHILKRAVGDISNDLKQRQFHSAAGTLDILKNYTRISTEMMENLESLVDHPCNALTFLGLVHESFDLYHFCFKKASNITPHEYSLVFFKPDTASDFKSLYSNHNHEQQLSQTIVLKNNRGPDSNMPNEIFLEIHAIVAQVLHMSGAGLFFDELFKKFPPSGSSPPAIRWVDLEKQISLFDVANHQTPRLGLLQA